MRKPTIKNLSKDLIETKKADAKKIVFDIIKEWIIENKEDGKQFRASFLDDKLNKDFDKIKDKIGEFKNISKISVLDFLGNIILGDGDKFFMELHEEFKVMRKKVHNQYENKKS